MQFFLKMKSQLALKYVHVVYSYDIKLPLNGEIDNSHLT